MSSPLDSPHERLSWAREQAGFATAADFSQVVDVHSTTYRAYENGQNGFAKHAAHFARKLGVTAEWLLEGGEVPEIVRHVRNQHPDLPPTRLASADDDTVEIAQIDLSFSMGPGITIDDYIEETPVRFDIGFLRTITRSSYDMLRFAKGAGDSMSPTLQGGDVVLIDTTQRHLNMQDRVYAISLYGAAAIKRLRAVGPQKVLIISDSPNVADQEVNAEDVIIAGRVIWFGREM